MLSKFERDPLTFGPSAIEPLKQLFAHLGGAPAFSGYSDTVCNG